MSKYIPRYHWPNGFTCKKTGEVWAFSPREVKAGYQRGVAKFVVYGRTPEEAEEIAHKKTNGIAYTPPNLSEPVGDALIEHKIKSAIGKKHALRTIIRKTKLSSDCVVKFLDLMVNRGDVLKYDAPYITRKGERKICTVYRVSTHKNQRQINKVRLGVEARAKILTAIKELTQTGVETTKIAIAAILKMNVQRVRRGLEVLRNNGVIKSKRLPGRNGSLSYSLAKGGK
jgi:hypothetical protein